MSSGLYKLFFERRAIGCVGGWLGVADVKPGYLPAYITTLGMGGNAMAAMSGAVGGMSICYRFVAMGVCKRLAAVGLAAVLVGAVGIAQRPAVGMGQGMGQNDTGPSFEVATIKPSAPEEHGRAIGWEGRHFTARYTTISQMVQFAYNLQEKQVVDAPAWFDTTTYDIEAQAEAGQPMAAEFRVMMQHLLAERFAMKTHREPRTLSAYALVVTKGGAKLGAVKEQPDMTPGVRIQRGPHQFMKVMGVRGTMPQLAAELQRVETDRPVVDRTGLTGEYDFSFTATSEKPFFAGESPATGDDAPPLLFTAIQEQLGLKLEPVKTEVECLVVDHVEKPSEN
jgi:uncharacterized protein (TIGR03435 family)